MIINRILKAGIAAGTSIMILATAAFSQNVATVNATQIFGTIDPAKINDYTEYMAGVNMYEALTTLDSSGNILPLLARWKPKVEVGRLPGQKISVCIPVRTSS